LASGFWFWFLASGFWLLASDGCWWLGTGNWELEKRISPTVHW